MESQLSGKDEEEANDFVEGLPEKSQSSKKHLTRQMSRQISSAKLGKKLIQIGGYLAYHTLLVLIDFCPV